MATNSASATRESRRRKILERGADRLALITGRTQTLPTHEHDIDPDAVPSQPLNFHPQNPTPDPPTASYNAKDEEFVSSLPISDSTIASGHNVITEEPAMPVPAPEETTSSIESSRGLNECASVSTSGTLPNLESRICLNTLVTPSQVSSAIAATERLRLFSSAAIAIFVVLSSLGFPMLGSNVIRTVLGFRPLYLVLLTNITLVIARLLGNNQRALERTTTGGEINNISSTSQDWVEQLGKALEIGLLMQKAIDALVMDCSVYAIIIIAGFSFIK